jgi:hypothetical protein
VGKFGTETLGDKNEIDSFSKSQKLKPRHGTRASRQKCPREKKYIVLEYPGLPARCGIMDSGKFYFSEGRVAPGDTRLYKQLIGKNGISLGPT